MKNLFSALSIFLAFTLPSGAQEFKEDVNFFPLLVEQPVRTGDRIEVLEIFWYGCPHCYALEPYLKKWLKNKPEFVEFVQLPAVLNRSWAFDARVFYTFVALGLIDELHEAYFDAIHKDRRRMKKVEQVASWAQEQGVDPQLILDTFNSDVQSWKQNVPVVITAGNGLTNNDFRGFKFDFSKCSFTNRNNVGDVFTQSYDWISNDNTTNLGSKITYN